jgi:ribosomal protein S18 acetylase RimI-like enzyme
MHIDIESLEKATLDAVAPEVTEFLPNWALPFDSTTVGRAISAVPLRHDGVKPGDIALIESRYVSKGLNAQFRVADVPSLNALHEALRSRGHTAHQPTLTMVSDIREWPQTSTAWTVHQDEKPSAGWESVYLADDFDPIDGANRLKALSRSRFLQYGWIEDSSGAVAAGTASFCHGWMSLHGLRSLKRVRGQGAAFALIQAFGKQARLRNLEKCFLQVEEGNANAIALYSRLGFQTTWRYHYWRR